MAVRLKIPLMPLMVQLGPNQTMKPYNLLQEKLLLKNNLYLTDQLNLLILILVGAITTLTWKMASKITVVGWRRVNILLLKFLLSVGT